MSLILSASDTARARVQRIRAHVEDVKAEIVAAYQERDWEALGYSSWDAYCEGEFGGGIAIPKSERGDLVFTLREAGMSYRAIEAATDMGRDTVHRVAEQVSENRTPEPSTITGTDGKTYQASRPVPAPAFDDDDVVDGEIVEDEEDTPRQRRTRVLAPRIDDPDTGEAERRARFMSLSRLLELVTTFPEPAVVASEIDPHLGERSITDYIEPAIAWLAQFSAEWQEKRRLTFGDA